MGQPRLQALLPVQVQVPRLQVLHQVQAVQVAQAAVRPRAQVPQAVALQVAVHRPPPVHRVRQVVVEAARIHCNVTICTVFAAPMTVCQRVSMDAANVIKVAPVVEDNCCAPI